MICPSKNSWPPGRQWIAKWENELLAQFFSHVTWVLTRLRSPTQSTGPDASPSQRILPALVGLPLLKSDECWSAVAAFWLNAEARLFVHDLWCESWTRYIYFFSCLCFWSHPSLMTERWQLDWSPSVKNSVHIFEFCSVVNDWEAEMKAFYIGEGISSTSIPFAIQSECLWFVLTHVPAPLLGGMNAHRVWQKLQTGCWLLSVLTDWLGGPVEVLCGSRQSVSSQGL